MKEQRRHQRIRFNSCPEIRIGQSGCSGTGSLENLSLGGLMLRTDLPLRVGEIFGCEFRIFRSPLIDLQATVVNQIGDRFGVRFQAGPVNAWLIQEAIDQALAQGDASVLGVNDVQGRRVMRIAGGLNASLRNDFMYNLKHMAVVEIDLSCVTKIDEEGLELCLLAAKGNRIILVPPPFGLCVTHRGDRAKNTQESHLIRGKND